MAQSDFISSARNVSLLTPLAHAAGANISAASEEIDIKGFRHIVVTIQTGAVAATAEGSLKLQESDTEGGSYTDIAGAVFPIAATDDDAFFRGHIDGHQRKRWIRLAGTTGTGGTSMIGAQVVLYGCANSAEYVDLTLGGADEVVFNVLS